jgi:hypothetical protein
MRLRGAADSEDLPDAVAAAEGRSVRQGAPLGAGAAAVFQEMRSPMLDFQERKLLEETRRGPPASAALDLKGSDPDAVQPPESALRAAVPGDQEMLPVNEVLLWVGATPDAAAWRGAPRSADERARRGTMAGATESRAAYWRLLRSVPAGLPGQRERRVLPASTQPHWPARLAPAAAAFVPAAAAAVWRAAD